MPIHQVSYFAENDFISVEQIPSLENSYRNTYAKVVGGIVLLIGLWLTYRRIKATEINAEVARRGEVTERLTRSIEQLHDPNLSIKIGGIYGLKRIALEENESKESIIEILTSYLQEHTKVIDEEIINREKEIKSTSPFDIIKSTESLLDIGERMNPVKIEHSDIVGLKLRNKTTRAIQINNSACLDWYLSDYRMIDFNTFKTIFSRCYFDRVNLNTAFLKISKFINGNIYNSNFQGLHSELSGFKGTTLSSNEFSKNSAFISCGFAKSTLRNNTFNSVNFGGSEFKEEASIQGNVFESCKFDECKFKDIDMKSNEFIDCSFEGSKFDESSILDNKFEKCSYKNIQIEDSVDFKNNKFQKISIADLESISSELGDKIENNKFNSKPSS